jgi:hypothetical protein
MTTSRAALAATMGSSLLRLPANAPQDALAPEDEEPLVCAASQYPLG